VIAVVAFALALTNSAQAISPPAPLDHPDAMITQVTSDADLLGHELLVSACTELLNASAKACSQVRVMGYGAYAPGGIKHQRLGPRR
jgi:hypothetical protein